MSNEWITDRLPTEQDSLECMVFTTTTDGQVVTVYYDNVLLGDPWQRIETPVPYVKPKRFKALWSESTANWYIFNNVGTIVARLKIDVEARSTAQRICDIYNEVMP